MRLLAENEKGGEEEDIWNNFEIVAEKEWGKSLLGMPKNHQVDLGVLLRLDTRRV
jgi:hypothetical protein